MQPAPQPIGERRGRLKDRLWEAETRYRNLVEQLPAVTYVCALDDLATHLYVSPQIEGMMGYTAEEWLADPQLWISRIHPEDRDGVIAEIARTIEEDLPFRVEYRTFRKDGGMIWIRDQDVVVHDASGEALYTQGLYLDITDVKSALEQEREVANRLRAVDDMKNTFLAAVSHELRTPLAAVLGTALTLQRGDDALGDEERRELVEGLVTASRKLDRLLSDLLDLDRLARGTVNPNLREIDVGAVARQAVEECDAFGTAAIRVEADPVMAVVDPAKIERIIENLVANAVRHAGPDPTVWVRVHAEAGDVLLTVEDDGPGVPDELKVAVFGPFERGEAASTSAPGTGIGLSLVAGFAALHGGRAWVEDRPGGGASFRVLLPGP